MRCVLLIWLVIASSVVGWANPTFNALLSAFNPANIAGLQIWLDATQLAGSDSSAVSSWTDVSGNSRSFTQATGTKQPLLRTGANGINSRNAVQFDGTDDFLSLSGYYPFDSGYTLFIVSRPTLVDGNWHTLFIQGDPAGATERAVCIILNGGFAAPVNSMTVFWEQAATTYGHNNAVSANTTYIHTVGRNGSTPVYYQDGVAGTVTGSSFDTNSNDPIVIGIYQDLSTYMYQGLIGEVLLYDTSLGSADRAAVEAYLLNKWKP